MGLLVVVGVVSCYVRVPSEHLDIVWAEDGEIFLRQHLDDGFWSTLFRGYAGYQHFVPRLAAAVAVPSTPLWAYPLAVFAICALLTGLAGAAVYWLSRDIVPWIPARIALGLITFVLPLAMQEVIGNLADLHSYAMWLAPWLLLSRPRRWWSATLWGVVAFAVFMTEVQAVLFLLLLPFVVRRSQPRTLPIAVGAVIGSIWQIVTVITVERGSNSEWFGIPSLLGGYLVNTVMPLLFVAPDSVRARLEQSGLIIPTVILLLFVIAFVVAMMWGSGRQRLLAIALAAASFAIYAGGVTIDGSAGFHYADDAMPIWERAVNIRYGVSSGMLLAALVPLAAAIVHARAARVPRAAVALRSVAWLAVSGLILTMSVASTRAISTRGWVEATWSYSVQTQRASCLDGHPDERRRLPIAPLREISLSCAQLRQ
ncbi:hypothetical protein FBY39_3240 [Microbacterium sp. SLBN-146]|nr:hypothetical protein FBY39_3240 [Microbacterium sp. SLBN-146]